MKTCEKSKVRKNHNIAFTNLALTIDEAKNYCVYDNNTIIKTRPVMLTDKTTKNDLENVKKNNHIVCFNDGEYLVKNDKKVAEYIKELFMDF